MHLRQLVSIWSLLAVIALPSPGRGDDRLGAALIFHAPFDTSADAAFAKGDGRIYTAPTLERKEIQPGIRGPAASIAKDQGRHGGALRFADASQQVLLYKADLLGYRSRDWSGTVSFWLKLDPDRDLKPGFCDPLQITARKWNDAAMFVDFDKQLPRDFRLGVYSDFTFWNPDNVPYDKIPASERPLITVKKPPFSGDRWTHIAYTFAGVNSAEPARAALYLNGTLHGQIRRPMQFRWKLQDAVMMIGINYIGDFDDLAVFDRALTAVEIDRLYKLPDGIVSLRK